MTGRANATAYGPMLIAAADRFRPLSTRIVDDPLAAAFLPGGYRLTAALLRYGWMRRMIERSTERLGRGLYANFLCRKRYLDDQLNAALRLPADSVPEYLTMDGIRGTLAYLETLAPGSRLVFTYVRRSFVDGTDGSGADRLSQAVQVKQRLFRTGFDPDEIPELLRRYGWQQLEQVGAEEYRERYLGPSGRGSSVSDLERAVLATKV